MRILIVGSGGREHALAWKAKQSDLVTEIFVAPGNGGTASEKDINNVDIPAENIEELSKFALKKTGLKNFLKRKFSFLNIFWILDFFCQFF